MTFARERDLQRAVIDLCRYLHLLVWHDNDSRKNRPGLPDLIICGPGGLLFRELKTSTGAVRPEQAEWITRLKAAGQDADVWRPTDWASGRIRTELTTIRTATEGA